MLDGYNLIQSDHPSNTKRGGVCIYQKESLAICLVDTYNSTYKYDFICIGETFLDSSFESENKDLMLDGYNLIQSDHPSNTKRGGVCVYQKESLAICLIDIDARSQKKTLKWSA